MLRKNAKTSLPTVWDVIKMLERTDSSLWTTQETTAYKENALVPVSCSKSFNGQLIFDYIKLPMINNRKWQSAVVRYCPQPFLRDIGTDQTYNSVAQSLLVLLENSAMPTWFPEVVCTAFAKHDVSLKHYTSSNLAPPSKEPENYFVQTTAIQEWRFVIVYLCVALYRGIEAHSYNFLKFFTPHESPIKGLACLFSARFVLYKEGIAFGKIDLSYLLYRVYVSPEDLAQDLRDASSMLRWNTSMSLTLIGNLAVRRKQKVVQFVDYDQ